MSEPNEPTPETDGTTNTEVEPTNGGTPTDDYQKRYDDLRPQYDKTQNELNALRQQQEAIRNDPEAQRQFLAELGYDLDEPDDEPAFDDDPVSALEQRLAAIEAKEQQAAAQAEHDQQLQAAEAHFNSAFQQLGDTRGTPLSDEEQNAVIGLALTMPPGDDGMPPVEQAAQALEAILEARQKQASEKQANATKRRPSHTFTPGGVAGEDKPDRSTHEGRVAAMLNQLSDTA